MEQTDQAQGMAMEKSPVEDEQKVTDESSRCALDGPVEHSEEEQKVAEESSENAQNRTSASMEEQKDEEVVEEGKKGEAVDTLSVVATSTVENKTQRKKADREMWKRKVKSVQKALAFRLGAKAGAYKERAAETESILRKCVSRYLYWCLKQGEYRACWQYGAASGHKFRGVVIFLDLKGYTNLAEHLASVDEMDNAILGREQFAVNDSSEVTNNVLSSYWQMVISFVHKFHGDVVKFLGDGLQIIFPTVPLFSAFPEEQADRYCMRRAVLFCMELMEALEHFKVAGTAPGFKRTGVKLGMAFGETLAYLLGGICNRFEFVIGGKNADRASRLSEVASSSGVSTIIDEDIAEAAGCPCVVGQAYSILSVKDKSSYVSIQKELTKEYEILTSEDPFGSPYLDPYQRINFVEKYRCCVDDNEDDSIEEEDGSEESKEGNDSIPLVGSDNESEDERRSILQKLGKDGDNAKNSSFTKSQRRDMLKRDYQSFRQSIIARSEMKDRISLTATREDEVEREPVSPLQRSAKLVMPRIFNAEEMILELEKVKQDENNRGSNSLMRYYEECAPYTSRQKRQSEFIFVEKERALVSRSELNVLGGFVPICALRQIVAGQYESHLGSRFCSIMFIELEDIDYNDPSQLDRLQLAVTEAQISIYMEMGDLRQVAADDKGFVIIGVFGVSGPDPDESALKCALNIRKRYTELGFKASIGIATGQCHFGITGSDYRSEYSFVGRTVNLAARIMGKASAILAGSAKQGLELSTDVMILFDGETMVGVHADTLATTDFASFEVELKGVSGTTKLFLPSTTATAMVLQNDVEVICQVIAAKKSQEAYFSSTHKIKVDKDNKEEDVEQPRSSTVIVSDNHGSLDRRTKSRPRAQRMSFMVQATSKLDFQTADIVREVGKYLAIFGSVNTIIDLDIFYGLLKEDVLRFDLDYALKVLCAQFHCLKQIDENHYELIDHEIHIQPVYQSLVRSFRTFAHMAIADLFIEKKLNAKVDIDKLPYNIYEVIGLHYAFAGEEYHLLAAEFLNRSLKKIDREDYGRIAEIARRSSALTKSWKQQQTVKAETVAAFAEYYLATASYKKKDYLNAFHGFKNVLSSYHAIRGNLFTKDMSSTGLSHRMKPTENILFVHYVDDSHSFSFRFRCLVVRVTEGEMIHIKPVECINKDVRIKALTKNENCVVEDLDKDTMEAHYEIAEPARKYIRIGTKFQRIILYDNVTSRQVLYSFHRLGRISALNISSNNGRRPSKVEQRRSSIGPCITLDTPQIPPLERGSSSTSETPFARDASNRALSMDESNDMYSSKACIIS